ncbi:unnamed protein product [Adineta ricciae]|uniref:Pyroglutamyl-peptidase 1-like protein n=1 Tax=Adineta ricciae TaxID=249248 RepID=A0A814ZHF5_ADIRI|nr:unnamed protein product [Adineta ricciae]
MILRTQKTSSSRWQPWPLSYHNSLVNNKELVGGQFHSNVSSREEKQAKQFIPCFLMNSSPQHSGIPVILITGFGPFRSVHKNPSWEVAQALKTYVQWTRPLHIITHQLQVTYDDVSKKIPDYWINYNPTLVVHIGVATGSKEVRMEKYACNTDYFHTDNNGSAPETGQCIKNDAPKVLLAQLPLSDICSRIFMRIYLLSIIVHRL